MNTPVLCPDSVGPNEDRGWLGKPPTVDEREIADWMSTRPLPARILHVGVGGGYLTSRFGARVAQAVTRHGAEAASAEARGLETIVCNKYDIRSYASLLAIPFDCIVDPNIRSYSCCDEHFGEFMELMRRSLSRGGALLTSRHGMDYLVPTSIGDLRRLCPEWRARTQGSVVVMRPRGSRFFWRLPWASGPRVDGFPPDR